MTLRTKGEQKAYLDGYETCAECIEMYLSDEGKKKLECLLMAVRNAVEIEDVEPQESEEQDMRLCKYDLSKECDGKYRDCVDCVLDKIKADVKALTDEESPEQIWNVDVLAIIDKYKPKSEDSTKIDCSKAKCENCTNHIYCDLWDNYLKAERPKTESEDRYGT